MLSPTYVQKLAVKYQTTDLNIRREYGQHVLLSYLYRQSQAVDLFFKGGTALRLIYRSPRFSEDLDFDASTHDHRVWEKAIEQTLVDISKEGFEVNIEESKVTTGGYLGIVSLLNFGDPIVIHFEISFRRERTPGEVFTIQNDFTTPYTINSLQTEQLVAGKLHALFDRQKPRDFYDVYFMLRSNMVAIKQKPQLKKVLELLSTKELNFGKELSVFLPRSQTLIIRDFKTTLRREIQRHV